MIVVAMRIPLVIATAVVLTVALVVGVVSLGATAGADRPLEPITVRAPAVPAPPQHLPEPAPRDPEGYVVPPPPVADDDGNRPDDDDGADDDD